MMKPPMPPMGAAPPATTVAVVAPAAAPQRTPGKMQDDASRLADLTEDDLELLASDPAAVAVIKKICPECAQELDTMLMAQEQDEGEEMEEPEAMPSPAAPARPSGFARPQTRLAKV